MFQPDLLDIGARSTDNNIPVALVIANHFISRVKICGYSTLLAPAKCSKEKTANKPTDYETKKFETG